MKTIYEEFKERQQKETNNLPIYFAFGNAQLQERSNELGFESIDDMINNVVGIGAGGFCKKEDYQKSERMQKLFKEAKEDYLKAMNELGW